MKIITPTGLGIREHDKWGSGLFKASRKKLKDGEWITYPHNGVDYLLCKPGQILDPARTVFAVTNAQFVREAYPYGWKSHYRGIMLVNDFAYFTIFYCRPYTTLHVGDKVRMGQEIGIAQNIVKKDPANGKYDGMDPHIHLQILVHGRNLLSGKREYINPESLM